MADTFEIAGGSVTGALHVLDGRPNQDAYHVLTTPTHTIIVIADGCSEGEHSEVGAHLGVRYAARGLEAGLDMFLTTPVSTSTTALPDEVDGMDHVWASAQSYMRGGIQDSLNLMGKFSDRARKPVTNSLFLFTLVAAVIDRRPGGKTSFAAIGDGFLIVNGEVIPFPKFPDNKPPYVAYTVVTSSIPLDLLRWNVLYTLPTAELRTFLVGTDGMDDFAAHVESPMPNSPRAVGPLSQFWEDDRFFKNPDMVRRKLVLCNGGVGLRTARAGLLRDDTTLVVGRRMPCSP